MSNKLFSFALWVIKLFFISSSEYLVTDFVKKSCTLSLQLFRILLQKLLYIW